MSALTEFKAAMRPGAVLEVTNHYIAREDHPAYGTTRRRVVVANSSAAHVAYDGQTATQRWEWPKAAAIGRSGRSFNIDYPGKPGVQYLTVTPVKEVAND